VGCWMLRQSHLWCCFFLPQRNPSGGLFPLLPLLGRHPFPPPTLGPSLWLPPPSISPPRSKDREEEEHVELKGKRASRRCSSPSILAEFLGETLGMDEIFVPPCNYVLLEVVDCWNLLSAARGSNGGSGDVNRVLTQDGNSSVNLASHGHCAGVFIGV
jgi:hypothetical protein